MLDPKVPVTLGRAYRLDRRAVSNELDAVRVLGRVLERLGERAPEGEDLGLARSVEPPVDRPGLRDRDEEGRLGRSMVVLVLGLEEGGASGCGKREDEDGSSQRV